MERTTRWSSICLILVAVALGACRTSGVTLTFPDFPGGVAEMVLGESLIINVTVANDGGLGVTWTCEGEACARPNKLTSSPTSATFTTEGVTGTATITATSIQQPTKAKSITVTVNEPED